MVKSLKKGFIIILSCFLYSLGYIYFILPNNFLSPGILGLGTFINYFTKASPWYLMAIISLLMGIDLLVYNKKIKFLDFLFLLSFPLMFYLVPFLKIEVKASLTVASIFSVILLSTSKGLLLKYGVSLDLHLHFLDPLEKALEKYDITVDNLFNAILILLSLYTFGLNVFVYNLIILYLVNVISSYIFLGINSSKVFYIFTRKGEEMEEALIKAGNGASLIETKNDISCIFCLIDDSNFYKINYLIEQVDKEAFVTIMNAYLVAGGIK